MTTLHRYLLLAIAAIVAALAGGCASTQITSAWRDPDLARVPFRKVLDVFQNRDPGLRRILEDEMARNIPNSVPSYTVLTDAEVRDVAKAKEKVRAQGFDSAVIMRIVSVQRERSYVPGQVTVVPGMYRDFWGYWGYGWTTVYEPGYLRDDRIVDVSTNVYSVLGDKLVWASESETFNPASLRSAIAEVVRVTARATADAIHATPR